MKENVYRFIAERINSSRGETGGKLSAMSTRIGLVSVAISITVIIVALTVVAGFKSEIRAKASGFMGDIVLGAPGQGAVNEKYPIVDSISYRQLIMDLGSVESISPVVYTSGLLRSDGEIYGTYFKGVDSLYNLDYFGRNLVEGELPDYHGRISDKILISQRLSQKMGFGVADTLTAYFIGEELKVRRFVIGGIFDAQLENLDNTIIIADARHVRRINGWQKHESSSIEIHIAERADVDEVGRQIEEIIFTSSQPEDSSLFVTTIRRMFSHLFDWLNLLDFNVLAVLVLMIAVAGFNMISTLLIILFERIRMIGLLKSMGMTGKGVTKVFMNVALNIVGRGLLWGNAIAVLLCLIQKWFKPITLNPENYFVKYVPIKLDFWTILIADIGSLGLIMVIMSLCSLFISKVSPDRTMRVG